MIFLHYKYIENQLKKNINFFYKIKIRLLETWSKKAPGFYQPGPKTQPDQVFFQVFESATSLHQSMKQQILIKNLKKKLNITK